MQQEPYAGFRYPMQFRVGPSHCLKKMTNILYSLSAVPLLLCNMTWPVNMGVALVLIFHAIHIHNKYLNNEFEVIRKKAGGWLLGLNNSSPFPVELLPMSFVHPSLTVLRFKSEHELFSVFLTGDNVNPAQFRRLRVVLNFPP